VAINPNHIPALNLLALLAANRDDGPLAREYAERALVLSPQEILAHIALATLEVGARNFSSARTHIEPLLNNPGLDAENRSIAQGLMGDVLDGEGDYAQAFRFYASAKERMASHYAKTFFQPKAEPVRARLARLRSYFLDASNEHWRARKAQVTRPKLRTHVFLTGFLRSGTTLLGQVLASHSDVEVMHERDCLADSMRDFIAPLDGLARLATLDDAALESYRALYWQTARGYGQSLDRDVFVDKAPLLTPLLPLVAKLFPDAKVLFVPRDPRDVVFSCFRRRFGMSEEKFQMLSLPDVAATYVAVMDLAEIYRGKLALDMLDARHETLISEFEPEARRICDFLDIAWQAEMANFGERARTFNIDIPNSAQLARGLSRESAGRWRHYKKELMPIMPTLAPWCARFGYPEN
jgi:hypothetical protein